MEAEEFLKNSRNIDYSKVVHINGLFDVLPFIEADLIEYAELYHEEQLSKLHQPTVISAVCGCSKFHGRNEILANKCISCGEKLH